MGEDNRCNTLGEAIMSMEVALSAWFKEHETA